MSQSLAKAYIHLVFSTNNREPLLADGWRDELFSVLGGTANNLHCQSIVVGGVADHIHMLFVLDKSLSIANAASKIKSTSSLWVNQTRGLPRCFNWQSGYGSFSVSQSQVQAVRQYINRQEEHHKRQTFQDEFRQWLRENNVEWDEQFL